MVRREMVEDLAIDIDELVSLMTTIEDCNISKSEITDGEPKQSLIYNVGDRIYDTKAYGPEIVSIGPYHHNGSPTLSTMQNLKWYYLDYILNLNNEKKLSHYIEAMKEIEDNVRACYANVIKMGKNPFRKMLLIDGCFLLRSLHGLEGLPAQIEGSNDYASIQSSSEIQDSGEFFFALEHLYNNSLIHDLLLVENQIPFFVLTKIHELVTDGRISFEVLVKNVIDCMDDMIGCYPIPFQEFERPKKFHHLLHLCRMYFRPTKKCIPICEKVVQSDSLCQQLPCSHTKISMENNSCDFVSQGSSVHQNSPWRRASEYHRAGIEFKKRDISSDNPHSLLDIKFCNGIMEIPILTIDPNTYSLFKNLIAFEQACPHFGNYVTAYVVFLCSFISMPDDVTLLTNRGIIEHQLNNDADVSTLFRELCEGVVFDFNSDYHFKCLCQVIEAYYQSQKPRFRQWISRIASKISHRAGNNESDLTEMLPPEQFV